MSGHLRRSAAMLVSLLVWLAACGSPTPLASTTVAPEPNPSGGATPTFEPSPSGAVTTYVVVVGDTLLSIARRFATSVAQLQAWNAERYPTLTTDPGTLEAGWELIVAGEAGVTPLPSATASPASTAGCHAGNRPASAPAGVYRTIPNAGHEMALTFDMGGRLDPALEILDFLVANHVCATLFPTGAMSATATGQRVLAVIRAHPELFEVGNHTMHHCDLVHGGLGSPTEAPCETNGRPSADFVRHELTDAAAILEAGTGQAPMPYWRPPYGTYDQTLLDVAAGIGYGKTLLWDIDTIDWKPISDGGPTAAQIADKVVSRAVSGSIVLDHLGGYETLAALKLMVPRLRQRGFVLTSISDLFDSP
ncbi:MAG TPA: polysaccharide deacetylase family protein [Candidatus Limnocylindria bacterium]|nr:polysaccharide deacetylase family protein [Candidatus Limnocylindria bacterium]